MKLTNILEADDRAVSPVIGVILMVAITVILAAVIGTFVLGLGSNVGNNAPQATITGSIDDPDLVLTHESGDEITLSNIEYSINGSTASVDTGPNGETWSAGETATFTDEGNPGTEWSVIWSSSSGGDSSIIASGTV